MSVSLLFKCVFGFAQMVECSLSLQIVQWVSVYCSNVCLDLHKWYNAQSVWSVHKIVSRVSLSAFIYRTVSWGVLIFTYLIFTLIFTLVQYLLDILMCTYSHQLCNSSRLFHWASVVFIPGFYLSVMWLIFQLSALNAIAATFASAAPLQLYQEDPVHQPLGLRNLYSAYTSPHSRYCV